MDDIDICEKQLALAKKSISDNEAKIKRMEYETKQKESEAETADNYYNQLRTIYQQAVTTFNNYKKDSSWKEILAGYPSCRYDWNGESCDRNCRSDKAGRFPDYGGVQGGATIGGNVTSRDCWDGNARWCECYGPNPNQYAANGRALVTALENMNLAEKDKIAKRRTATEYAQRQIPSPEINIACCINSVTCGTEADCNKITQACESKIDEMKSKKVETEKVETEKLETGKKVIDNQSTQTGQKSIGNISKQTNSPPNDSLISSSIILCCCLLLIILLIMLYQLNKKI
jgi:hypothetical protein